MMRQVWAIAVYEFRMHWRRRALLVGLQVGRRRLRVAGVRKQLRRAAPAGLHSMFSGEPPGCKLLQSVCDKALRDHGGCIGARTSSGCIWRASSC